MTLDPRFVGILDETQIFLPGLYLSHMTLDPWFVGILDETQIFLGSGRIASFQDSHMYYPWQRSRHLLFIVNLWSDTKHLTCL